MSVERVLVKISQETGTEDHYFKKLEQEKIQALRKKSTSAADDTYKDAHRNHCFRCGTASLAEVKKGDITIDVCVNKDCGAVHLDPGELESIAKDQGAIKSVRAAIFSVFN